MAQTIEVGHGELLQAVNLDEQSMRPRFRIPRILQQHCEGQAELDLDGSTVRSMLVELSRVHPALYRCICDETGSVRPHINLFVNNTLIRGRDGLEAELASDDVVSVFQAVSGG